MRENPLSPRKAPSSRPKMDERARKLLEADLNERPATKFAQRCEYLEKVAGVRVSESTVCRMIKRLGFSRKKKQERQRAGRSPRSLPGRVRLLRALRLPSVGSTAVRFARFVYLEGPLDPSNVN